METSTLEVTVISAEGLKNKNKLWKRMSPYVIAWIDPEQKKQTKALPNSGKNPIWNETLTLPLNNSQTLQNPHSTLVIQVLCDNFFQSKMVIGTSSLPLNEIRTVCTQRNDGESKNTVTLQLWRPSGRACGMLKVALKLNFSSFATSTKYNSIPMSYPSISQPGMESTFSWSGDQYLQPPVQGIAVGGLYPFVAENDSRSSAQEFENRFAPSAPPLPQSNDGVKSFVMGLLSGAAAAIVIGGAVIQKLKLNS
eukprot:TRINITY_DN17663_c0_g1_i1.p1 TRINITY_DN17663_c0_g1~~TRINITY_DN17663_c0_g1_i1.p1  ORF type:complete len:252 (+),score=28.16 TRINITY_DN17663_c0_g1_i1:233-988(+)